MSVKSLIQELQEEVFSSNGDVSTLLRKALVVAKKLNEVDFEEWIKKELNGYSFENDTTPDYRIITTKLKAWNPYYGWIPVKFEDKQLDELVSNRSVLQSLAEVEEWVSTDDDVAMSVPHELVMELSKEDPFVTEYKASFSKSQLIKIMNSVRNILLDWLLKLDQDGDIGRTLVISKENANMSQEKGYTVNHFYGNINQSQIQQNSDNSSQTMIAGNELDSDKIIELINVIRDNVDNIELTFNDRNEILNALSKIYDELQKKEPDPSFVKKSFQFVGRIIENVTGNLIASGIQHEITKLF